MVMAKSGGNELLAERHECPLGERQVFSRYYVWKFGIMCMSSGIGTQRGTSIVAAVTRVKGYVSKEGVDEIMTREL
jgi:hypothetical protein